MGAPCCKANMALVRTVKLLAAAPCNAHMARVCKIMIITVCGAHLSRLRALKNLAAALWTAHMPAVVRGYAPGNRALQWPYNANAPAMWSHYAHMFLPVAFCNAHMARTRGHALQQRFATPSWRECARLRSWQTVLPCKYGTGTRGYAPGNGALRWPHCKEYVQTRPLQRRLAMRKWHGCVPLLFLSLQHNRG